MDGKYSGSLETVYKKIKTGLSIALVGITSVLPVGCSLEKYSRIEKAGDVPHNRLLTVDQKSLEKYTSVESKHGFFDEGNLRFRVFSDSNRDGKESFGEDAFVVNVVASDSRSLEALERGLKKATGVKVKGDQGAVDGGELSVHAEDLVLVGKSKGGK